MQEWWLRGTSRGSRARVVHGLLWGLFVAFKNGAAVREWRLHGSERGLPCESVVHRECAARDCARGSRAGLVHFLIREGRFGREVRTQLPGASVREWCTDCYGTHFLHVKMELRCESGARIVIGLILSV